MADVDAVVKELSEIQDRLLELPRDAFAEIYQLHSRRDELRAQAAEFALDRDAGRSTEELLRELAALRTRLAEIERQQVNLVVQAGGGGARSGSSHGVVLNRRIADAQGMGRVQSRIGVIKGVLIDRAVEVPD